MRKVIPGTELIRGITLLALTVKRVIPVFVRLRTAGKKPITKVAVPDIAVAKRIPGVTLLVRTVKRIIPVRVHPLTTDKYPIVRVAVRGTAVTSIMNGVILRVRILKPVIHVKPTNVPVRKPIYLTRCIAGAITKVMRNISVTTVIGIMTDARSKALVNVRPET